MVFLIQIIMQPPFQMPWNQCGNQNVFINGSVNNFSCTGQSMPQPYFGNFNQQNSGNFIDQNAFNFFQCMNNSQVPKSGYNNVYIRGNVNNYYVPPFGPSNISQNSGSYQFQNNSYDQSQNFQFHSSPQQNYNNNHNQFYNQYDQSQQYNQQYMQTQQHCSNIENQKLSKSHQDYQNHSYHPFGTASNENLYPQQQNYQNINQPVNSDEHNINLQVRVLSESEPVRENDQSQNDIQNQDNQSTRRFDISFDFDSSQNQVLNFLESRRANSADSVNNFEDSNYINNEHNFEDDLPTHQTVE